MITVISETVMPSHNSRFGKKTRQARHLRDYNCRRL